jgi:hypothetical protein
MITIAQPALALHSCDVPGFLYQMKTTWKMPPGATAQNVVYWIQHALDQSDESRLANVVINCHGGPGKLYVGGGKKAPVGIGDVALFGKLRARDIGTVWLVGCLVAIGSGGERFCKQLAIALGCDVVGANDYQFVEGGYMRGNCPFGTIDEFEGAAYRFGPDGSKEVLSVHEPLAEDNY